jgi:hypothetical protein
MLAIGWLALTLGGLCTLIFGAMALGGDHEFHIALEDWTLPGGMLLFGVGCIWAGRAMRRRARRPAVERPDE